MTGSSIYAAQKTREAVNCLSLLDKSLRERLYDAVFAMHILKSDEIPDEGLQAEAVSIISSTLESGIPDNHQLTHMTDEAVVRNARRMVELFERCIALYTTSPSLVAKG